MPGVEQQKDVGTEADIRLGGPAVVAEERLAFWRRKVDTGHGTSPWGRNGGVCHDSHAANQTQRAECVDRLFTADGAWHGGFYELALEVGPRSDEHLQAALSAIWSHPAVSGCYLDRGREPGEQQRVSPKGYLEDGSHLLGVAHLPNGVRAACGTCLIREVDNGPDWLDFYLPMGSLGAVYPAGAFPFGTEGNPPGPWRREVEGWLAELGLWVSRSASYRLGLVGFEVSGEVYAAEVASKGLPPVKHVGYLWPSGSGMSYHPRSPGTPD